MRVLAGEPSKEQTLALVGWLAMANAFGPITADDVDLRGHGLPPHATYWVGQLMALTGRGHRRRYPTDQNVISNRRRRVRARRPHDGGLVTGKH